LPNILAGRELVPELIQHEATPEKLGEAVGQYLTRRDLVRRTRKALAEVQRSLRRNANVRAAEAVIKMLKSRKMGKSPV
jgi:lipid-A-disaccharide synthase